MSPPVLPLDVLVNILHWLPPTRALLSPSVRTLVSCSIASSLLREAASLAAVWEPHYRARYRHCQREKEEKRRESVNSNWKDLYLIRQHLDNEALGLVRSMIYEVHSRTDATQQLLDFGMDVWDVLSLSHERQSVLHVLESEDPLEFGPDPLTWEYWTESVARGLTKQDAIKAWSSMLASKPGAPDEGTGFVEAQCYTSSFFGVPQLDVSRRVENWTYTSFTWQVMEQLSSLSHRCKSFLESREQVHDPEAKGFDLSSLCCEIFMFMQSEGLTLASGISFSSCSWKRL
jgi:F-box protein 21